MLPRATTRRSRPPGSESSGPELAVPLRSLLGPISARSPSSQSISSRLVRVGNASAIVSERSIRAPHNDSCRNRGKRSDSEASRIDETGQAGKGRGRTHARCAARGAERPKVTREDVETRTWGRARAAGGWPRSSRALEEESWKGPKSPGRGARRSERSGSEDSSAKGSEHGREEKKKSPCE